MYYLKFTGGIEVYSINAKTLKEAKEIFKKYHGLRVLGYTQQVRKISNYLSSEIVIIN